MLIGIIILILVSLLNNNVYSISIKKLKEKDLESSTNLNVGLMDSAWPMFCHDVHHTGRIINNISGNTLIEKWKIKLDGPITYSSPVISKDGTIYVGADGPGNDATLYAINPNGTTKWSYFIEKENDGEVCDLRTPAINEEGTIYVGSLNGYLYAINPDGSLKWKMKLHQDWLKNGIFSSLAIGYDGTIYTGAYEKIFAVTPNGTIKWSYTTGNIVRSSPVIGEDGTVYVASHDCKLYAFNPETGEKKWHVNLGGKYLYSSPAIDDNGIIYIGNYYCDLYAVFPNGTVKWVFDGNFYPITFGPIIGFDNTIYCKGDDKLWAINPDGTQKWVLKTGIDVSTPAIVNNGFIYMSGDEEISAGSDFICLISVNGEKLYNLKLFADEGDDIQWVVSSPAISSDGIVYIGSWSNYCGYLHAIETIESTMNNPPYKPTLAGGLYGKAWVEKYFSVIATDPEVGEIYYFIDWGDNSTYEWIGPCVSGKSEDIYHTWYENGTYELKVKARDKQGLESEWSDTVVIIIQKTRGIDSIFLKLINNFLRYHPILFPRLR